MIEFEWSNAYELQFSGFQSVSVRYGRPVRGLLKT